LTLALTECNYRGHVNQQLANLLGLPYSPSIARVAFRALHQTLPREVDDRILSIELANQAYMERVAAAHRLPELLIELPVLTAVVLARSATRGELWSSLAEVRAEATLYRARRADLEISLADGDQRTIDDVARAVRTEVARLRDRLRGNGRAMQESAVTVAEALPEVLSSPFGLLGPALSGLFAAGRALLPAELAERLIWRLTRPHYRFLSDIRTESRAITKAMPRIQRFWAVPDSQAAILADRFGRFAEPLDARSGVHNSSSRNSASSH
jgi:hypothetical protein